MRIKFVQLGSWIFPFAQASQDLDPADMPAQSFCAPVLEPAAVVQEGRWQLFLRRSAEIQRRQEEDVRQAALWEEDVTRDDELLDSDEISSATPSSAESAGQSLARDEHNLPRVAPDTRIRTALC